MREKRVLLSGTEAGMTLTSWHPREDSDTPINHPYSRIVWQQKAQMEKETNIQLLILFLGRN